MSFSSRDITKAVQTGHPPGSPVFSQALMDSREQRQREQRRRDADGILRNNTGGRPADEVLRGRAAVQKLMETHLRHATPDCASLEIYPPGRDQAPVWAVRDVDGGLRCIMSVLEPGKSRNIWRD